MKLLYLHANDLQICAGVSGATQAVRNRNEARLRRRLGDLLAEMPGGPFQSKNALLALVCIERGDAQVNLDDVRKSILDAQRMVGAQSIVLSAFGHLSTEVARPQVAFEIMQRLASVVPEATLIPFGWDKSLEINVPLHHYNISFKSFTPAGRWDSAAADYDAYMAASGHYSAQGRLISKLISSGYVSGNVLDLCCGAGFVLEHIIHDSRAFGVLVGIDSSISMLALAAARLDSAVTLVAGNSEDVGGLLFSPKFNAVLMVNAAAYVDLQATFESVRKLMAPNARLIIMDEDPFVPGFFVGHPELDRASVSVGASMHIAAGFGFKRTDSLRTAIDDLHSLVATVLEL